MFHCLRSVSEDAISQRKVCILLVQQFDHAAHRAVSENAIGKTTVRVVSPIDYRHVLSLDELFYVFLLRQRVITPPKAPTSSRFTSTHSSTNAN